MERQRQRVALKQATNRARIDEYKLAHGCADCGYREHAVALDLDHRPGEGKTEDVSQLASRAWERIEAELMKCDVVCANCHRVRTARRVAEEGRSWKPAFQRAEFGRCQRRV